MVEEGWDREDKWDVHYIRMAQLAADMSKDRSTRVGAIVVGDEHEVLSTGFNGFPRRVDDDVDERHERPAKYSWTCHAERNAVFNAARNGVALKGGTLYLNWEPYPCPECARAIIQSGIIAVVGPDVPFPGSKDKNSIDWQEGFKITKQMFEESGVLCRIVKWKEVKD